MYTTRTVQNAVQMELRQCHLLQGRLRQSQALAVSRPKARGALAASAMQAWTTRCLPRHSCSRPALHSDWRPTGHGMRLTAHILLVLPDIMVVMTIGYSLLSTAFMLTPSRESICSLLVYMLDAMHQAWPSMCATMCSGLPCAKATASCKGRYH
jgi:hypothetical protein